MVQTQPGGLSGDNPYSVGGGGGGWGVNVVQAQPGEAQVGGRYDPNTTGGWPSGENPHREG